jgi:PAS domain S-box-containing protein
MQNGPFRIAIIYVIISILWITFSDRLLFFFAHQFTQHQFLLIGSAKGYFFVIANGCFLYYLIRKDDVKLKQSENQYRNMYEANPVPMWIYDEGLKIISVNDAAIKTYGYSRNEFLTKSILDIRPREDTDSVTELVKRLTDDLNLSGTWRHIKKDGTLIYVNITSQKIIFNNRPNVMVMIKDMTERILFEQTLEKINQDLKNEKRKLRETQLISKVGGWVFFPETKKLIWSDELYTLTGVSKEDPREAFDIYLEHIFPEDRQMMIQGLDDLINEGKAMDITHRILAINGETHYIRQLAFLDDEDPAVLKVVGSMQDITELKQLEIERNKYQYSLENTLNSISDAFFALDHHMNITRINQVFRDLMDEKITNIVGESIFTLFPKEKNHLYPYYQKALEERIIVKQEEYSVILNKWIRLAAYPTEDGVAVYFSDITEDKLKDTKLKDAIERYELVAQATKDVIYDLNITSNHIVYNTSLTQLIEIPYDQIEYGLEWWRGLIHPDDVTEVKESQRKISSEGKTNWECEYRVNCGNGHYKYIMDQGYFIYNDHKEPIRLIGVIKDIDDLKRSTQENKRLADIITRVNNMIIVTDAENRVQWINKAFEDIAGFNLVEMGGREPFELLREPGMDESEISSMYAKQKMREAFSVDLVIYTKFKIPLWVSVELTPMFDDHGIYLGYIAVYQNITLRKEKEQEIQRQNEFLKEVAWMSSHEIRRPVATMLGLINLADIAESEEEKEEIFALLRICVNEMDGIVYQIHHKIGDVVDLS